MDTTFSTSFTNIDDLYREHRDWLLRFLRHRFRGQDPEDLLQETFLNISGKNVNIQNPRAYLAQVAIRAAINANRKQNVRPYLVSDDLSEKRSALQADQTQAILLKQVILNLPQPLRDTFMLSRFAELSYADIAQRLGISVKTVEWRMSKALALCTAALFDED